MVDMISLICNKNLMNRLLIVTSISFLLAGCYSGNNIQSNVNADDAKLSIQPNDLPYIMGGTYDTTTAHPTATSSCLNAGQNGSYVLSSPSARINFSETQSLDEVLSALGINAAVHIGWGPFSTTISYNYANSSQDDAYSLNLNYIYKYAATAYFPSNINMQGESALTPSAQGVVGLPVQFRTMCGDRFIAQMDAGASVLMRLKLKFISNEDKNYFDTHLKRIHGLNNVLSIIESNPTNIHYQLVASGLQGGGNPQLLNAIFECAGGKIDPDTGYASINCETGKKSPINCANLVTQIIDYASTIKGQLSESSSFYFSNPLPGSWSSIGISPGDVNPSQDDLDALNNITTLYNQDQQSNRFILQYGVMLQNYNLLSPTMNQDLMNLYALYQNILSIYTDPSLDIMDCYNGFVSSQCVTINTSLVNQRNQIINSESQLFNLLSYLESNQYVSGLVIESGMNNEAYCGFYPITGSAHSMYMVNCDGQASGTFGTAEALTIIPGPNNTLTINNLAYNYTDNKQENKFSYQLGAPLIPVIGIHSAYNGYADVYMNGEKIDNQHLITLTRKRQY